MAFKLKNISNAFSGFATDTKSVVNGLKVVGQVAPATVEKEISLDDAKARLKQLANLIPAKEQELATLNEEFEALYDAIENSKNSEENKFAKKLAKIGIE